MDNFWDFLFYFCIYSSLYHTGSYFVACTGRLNETSLFILREGVFYGQCSEICGVGHSNMPIAVEAVSVDKYIAWLSEKI